MNLLTHHIPHCGVCRLIRRCGSRPGKSVPKSAHQHAAWAWGRALWAWLATRRAAHPGVGVGGWGRKVQQGGVWMLLGATPKLCTPHGWARKRWCRCVQRFRDDSDRGQTASAASWSVLNPGGLDCYACSRCCRRVLRKVRRTRSGAANEATWSMSGASNGDVTLTPAAQTP